MTVQRRNTRQRKLVLEAVRHLHNHPTADEVFTEVRRHDDHISRGTVYRNLALLAEDGDIQLLKTPGGSHFDDRCDAHAHLLCTSCGAVEDVELPYRADLDAHAACTAGYSNVSHYTFFEGTCPVCQRRQKAHAYEGKHAGSERP